MSARFLSTVGCAVVFVLACSKNEDPGPACDRVVDHMLDVTKQALLGHESMTADLRKQMIAQCVQRNLSKQVRECMMAAKDSAALAACNRQGQPVAPTARPALPPVPQPTAPAGSGIPAP
jgi:hypothetical protein